jgi:hypothetical protein
MTDDFDDVFYSDIDQKQAEKIISDRETQIRDDKMSKVNLYNISSLNI